jgi:hypothetical protein
MADALPCPGGSRGHLVSLDKLLMQRAMYVANLRVDQRDGPASIEASACLAGPGPNRSTAALVDDSFISKRG